MSSHTVIVSIDQSQIVAQKANNYGLYLAKKVNGAFTVIWQAIGPIPTVDKPRVRAIQAWSPSPAATA